MNLTFRFRLQPTARQYAELDGILNSQRWLYNQALAERKKSYEVHGKTVSFYDQAKWLTQLRSSGSLQQKLPANLQRATLKRLDNAYKGFFRRLKSGQKPGFPRFKGHGYFSSFGFAEFSGIRFRGSKLYFQGLSGGLRVRRHRQLPEGAKICGCTFKRSGSRWHLLL